MSDVSRIFVDQRLHLKLDQFPASKLDEIRGMFVHDNPEFAKWKAYRPTPHPPREFVATWKQSQGWLHVPRGRTNEVLAVLDGTPGFHRNELELRYAAGFRDAAASHFHFKLDRSSIEDRDYQTRLVEAAVVRETALWRAPPASGKTIATFQLIEKLGVRSLVCVPTRPLLDQWVRRVQESFGFKPGVIQGKTRNIGPITIATQATLLNCIEEVADQFGLLVCDEVQLFAAKTFNEIIERSPSRYRLGVSGDERRADGKEYLLHDQFGPPAAEVDRDELVADGSIVDVVVRMIPSSFSLPWYEQLPPAEKFRQRQKMLDAMQVDDERNAQIVQAAKWCLDEGEQVAVLSARREHCDRLDVLVQQLGTTVGQLVGGDGAAFDDVRERFASGDFRAVVGTFKAIGVGFESHKRLARGVFATPIATQKTAQQQFMQFLGRFARPAADKADSFVYMIFDPYLHGDRPVRLIKGWVTTCEVLDANGAFIPAQQFLKGKNRAKTQRRGSDIEQPSEPDDDLFKSANRRE